MPGILPAATPCCDPCEDVPPSQVPGPSGLDGVNGSDGAAGVNAFTLTTAQFLMPAEGATVVVAVANSTWISSGQILYVQTAGYMKVTALPTSTSVTLQNPENTGTGVYQENVAAGTAISAGVKVCPAGLQGPAGAGAAGQLLASNNLSDVASAATSRTNLGLGSIATQAANNVAITAGAVGVMTDVATAATIRTNIGAQPSDAELTALAGLTSAADKVPYFTGAGTAATADLTAAGRAFIAGTTEEVQRTILEVMRRQGLLGILLSVNFNSTADQAIPIISWAVTYVIRRIVVCNASTSLTTAVGGIYGAAAKSAPVIVAATHVYSALTSSAKFKDLTLEAICGTDVFTQSTLYISLTTAQGAAATADVLIFGEVVGT